MPFERYLRRAPRTVHIPSLKMAQAKLMLYECYEKKIAADLVDDRVRSVPLAPCFAGLECGRSLSGYLVYQNNVPREPMPKFMFNFFMQKYGLHSLSHGYLFALVRLLKLNDGLDKQKSLRMHLFSMAAGLHEKSGAGYTVLLMDVMLNLLKALVPKFSATKYANHKYASVGVVARCQHVVLTRVIAAGNVDALSLSTSPTTWLMKCSRSAVSRSTCWTSWSCHAVC